MQVIFTRQFDKQTAIVLPKQIKIAVIEAIVNVENANKISDIKHITKLKANKTAYRIKLGDYRIGLYIKKGIATFVIFAHRKDIYKFFP
jgi:mRNA interferase RelE/StbE